MKLNLVLIAAEWENAGKIAILNTINGIVSPLTIIENKLYGLSEYLKKNQDKLKNSFYEGIKTIYLNSIKWFSTVFINKNCIINFRNIEFLFFLICSLLLRSSFCLVISISISPILGVFLNQSQRSPSIILAEDWNLGNL